jgi:hypothetical protein
MFGFMILCTLLGYFGLRKAGKVGLKRDWVTCLVSLGASARCRLLCTRTHCSTSHTGTKRNAYVWLCGPGWYCVEHAVAGPGHVFRSKALWHSWDMT